MTTLLLPKNSHCNDDYPSPSLLSAHLLALSRWDSCGHSQLPLLLFLLLTTATSASVVLPPSPLLPKVPKVLLFSSSLLLPAAAAALEVVVEVPG